MAGEWRRPLSARLIVGIHQSRSASRERLHNAPGWFPADRLT